MAGKHMITDHVPGREIVQGKQALHRQLAFLPDTTGNQRVTMMACRGAQSGRGGPAGEGLLARLTAALRGG
jgi:hypothetical protein